MDVRDPCGGQTQGMGTREEGGAMSWKKPLQWELKGYRDKDSSIGSLRAKCNDAHLGARAPGVSHWLCGLGGFTVPL